MLAELAQQLRKLKFPTSPVSVRLAQFAADSFNIYLEGKAQTLDEAFGLKPRRGAPGIPKRREAIARAAFKLRLAGESWKKIADELGGDERTIREYYTEFKTNLLCEEINRTWDNEDGA